MANISSIVPFLEPSFGPSLWVIVGPTASGKTSLALALADRLPMVIVSADSRLVYRELDIGTAKPTLAQQQQVTHKLIDICEPTQILTVADYQQQAQAMIAQVHATRQAMPVLVGGTGLYIDAVTKGLKIPRVAPQRELRSQLTQLGQRQCYAFLQQVDPLAAQRIHANDQIRTLRALEVYYVTGQPISAQQGENPPSYPILYIGLDCVPPERLNPRIQTRIEQMIEQGLIAEVQTLLQRYGPDLPLLKTLGYAEMVPYILGETPLAAAIEQCAQNTRQFAKRQRTWFRKNPAIHWFDPESPTLVEQVWQQIENFVERISSNQGG
jgi:tRNA dimethylallyltransferase